MRATRKPEVGCIVWHDLLTSEVAKAKRFYAELLGWEYQIEHASDFAWNSGEGDYPLILANGEAHGGFVDPGRDIPCHWVGYVMVEDVDGVVVKARKLGATIERQPFDIPGVGRSGVVRDPDGAIICPYMPTHDFPSPSGAFLWDELVTDDVESAKEFYGDLLGWKASDIDMGQMGTYCLFKCGGGIDVAGVVSRPLAVGGPPVWLTYLAADDVDTTAAKARKLGAITEMEGIDLPNVGRIAILVDPTGAVFGLLKPNEA